MFNKSNTNKPFSLNINPDTLPDVSFVHDSTTDEVHLKFFNVDDELVLDLWGQLNDVGSLISGLSTIAKYYALLVDIDEAVAKEDWAGAVECLNTLKSLQLTPGIGGVFENVDVTTSESPKKGPEEHPVIDRQGDSHHLDRSDVGSGIAVLTGEEAEALLAMLDEKFNGK